MNEAAFPNPHLRDGSGMTIRDVYAGLAMQALVSHPERDMDFEDYASWAYGMADAMMKAREE
jgi:hypothetical protein